MLQSIRIRRYDDFSPLWFCSTSLITLVIASKPSQAESQKMLVSRPILYFMMIFKASMLNDWSSTIKIRLCLDTCFKSFFRAFFSFRFEAIEVDEGLISTPLSIWALWFVVLMVSYPNLKTGKSSWWISERSSDSFLSGWFYIPKSSSLFSATDLLESTSRAYLILG